MAQNCSNFLSVMVLASSIQGAWAGEAWLVITSDPPGAAILVDNAYRGVTPQHPGDALRVKAVEGVSEIQARKQIDGREYVVRQNIEVIGNKEIPVQINLREQTDSPAVTATTPQFYRGSPGIGPTFPLGKMEVPGKNF